MPIDTLQNTLAMNWFTKFITFLLLCFSFLSTQAQETEIYTERNIHIKKGLEMIDDKVFLAAQKEFEFVFNQTKKQLDNEQIILNIISQYYYAYCAYKLDQPNTELLYTQFIKADHESKYRRMAYFDLGNYFFANKKTSEALKWYEKVDKSDLSNEDLVIYKFNMAYTYFTKKKFAEAKPLFRDIKNAQNDYQEPANYYYGFISFFDEDYKEAKKSFEGLKDSKLYAKVVPYYLVQIYFMEKEYQKTIDFAEPMLADKETKNLDEIKHIVGQAHFELGNYTESIPLLQNYIEKTKKVSKEEMYQLAFAQYKTAQYTDAIENLLPLSVVQDSLGQNAMYLLGNSYLNTDNKSMARDAFLTASALNLDPFITEVSSFQFAKLSYELDYYTIAINSLTDFIAKYPSSNYKPEALNLVSNVLLKTKNYARAIEIIENNNIRGAKIDATYQKVTLFRAVELHNEGKNNEALILADKSIKKPIDQDLKAHAIFLKALIFYQQEKYIPAIEAFAWFKQFAIKNEEDWASKKLANYNIAYAHFKLKKYDKASTYFEEALKEFNPNKVSERSFVADASLRNADCLLMIKNYDRALSFYDKVIDNNWAAKEYALLQKSVIYGLIGNYNSKISSLQSLLNQYPKSQYADQSQFEIADAYLQQTNIPASIAGFDKFIKKYPNSQLMPEAYLKLGLLYSNAGNESKALQAYKNVVLNYPNAEEAKEALVALKGLYIVMGKPNDYIKFVENEAGLSVSVSEQEALMFQSAEEKYQNGKCAPAVDIINEYLSLFPEGSSNLDAYFYRADCSFKAKNYNQAYKDYKAVAAKGNSKYFEEALLKSTFIAYEINKNYDEANYLYNELYTYATLKSNREIAQIGLMRSYFKIGSNTEVLRYANEVLNDENISLEVKGEANFYKAKALFETNKLNQALVVFEEVIAEQPVSKISAEAAYHIALIKYKKGSFEDSKADCFSIKNEYASYTYWVVKTFILLADNYKALDNVFQAKATLQSIINNYDGDQLLLKEAKEKYDILLALELKNSKIDLESDTSDELQFDE